MILVMRIDKMLSLIYVYANGCFRIASILIGLTWRQANDHV